MTAGDSRTKLLALHLAAGKPIVDAAREAGVSESTAHRLLRTPRFVARVRRVQGQTRNRVVGRLTDACTAAVDTLLALLADDQPPNARLGAARAILEHAGRMTETVELECRIGELESSREVGYAQEPSA